MGTEGRLGGLEGWHLGREVWMFLQEMWRTASCKLGKELRRGFLSTQKWSTWIFHDIFSTLSQYAHDVYHCFEFFSAVPGEKYYCMQHDINSEPMNEESCSVPTNITSSFLFKQTCFLFVWDCYDVVLIQLCHFGLRMTGMPVSWCSLYMTNVKVKWYQGILCTNEPVIFSSEEKTLQLNS